MKNYSLRNYLSMLMSYSCKHEYKLSLLGRDTRYVYTITYKDRKLTVLLSRGEEDDTYAVEFPIENRSDLNNPNLFKDKDFTFLRLKETQYKSNGQMYKETRDSISYEAQAYLVLFRILGESVQFRIEYKTPKGLQQKDCLFLNGKVTYTERKDNKITVYRTELFSLAKEYKNYEILFVNPLLQKPKAINILNSLEDFAKKNGLDYVFVNKGNQIKTKRYA